MTAMVACSIDSIRLLPSLSFLYFLLIFIRVDLNYFFASGALDCVVASHHVPGSGSRAVVVCSFLAAATVMREVQTVRPAVVPGGLGIFLVSFCCVALVLLLLETCLTGCHFSGAFSVG